ncbi:sugar kinase [Cupriavidus taiwanensis]|uniref:Carbohydrate kinase, pfkB family n=1 Tax=Cupriavidus taiwanensis TaxID=164546 RepID=A0A375JET4_9BURK|nr:sugar kinase [Cupriavidus taiwanensis]SPS03081.1 Putative carbohydrate kinase, pfkB family [Cupriavidus taiwanensis]
MRAQFDIVALGEAMVEFNHAGPRGSRTYLQGFGGDTSNAVIAAARQGARCAYVTRLGDDEFGRMYRCLLRREHVDTSGVVIDASAPTGLYFVHHGPDGHVFTYRRSGSAASRMQPGDLPVALLERAAWLHVSGISQAISTSATRTVREAIRIARQAGTKVSYDPNLRLTLWPLERAREVIIATLPLCDLFLPSLDDVRQLAGIDEPTGIVDWCHRMGAPHVVLKLGSQGCLVSDGEELTAVAPLRVDAVDATGAGDCFDGTYLARLVAGDDPVSAARWAAVAAALATTGHGAVAPLPGLQSVWNALKAQS